MLTELYGYYIDHPEAMSREYVALIEKKGVPKTGRYVTGFQE